MRVLSLLLSSPYVHSCSFRKERGKSLCDVSRATVEPVAAEARKRSDERKDCEFFFFYVSDVHARFSILFR